MLASIGGANPGLEAWEANLFGYRRIRLLCALMSAVEIIFAAS
ncbi:hypothetical protein [Rhizobium laguerreae]|nr:hypothetical protein [Rhizobium laguerreae]